LAGEFDTLAPELLDEAKPVILEQMLGVGAEGGPKGVKRLKQELLARYGRDGEFDKHQQRCRRQIELSAGRETSPGVWDYKFTTDNEGRAVVEAAIGPLSAPRVAKDADGRSVGPADERTAGRRRGEALIEALRRSVTATDERTGEPTANPKAVLMLTMDFDALQAQCGAARVVGTPARVGPLVAACRHRPCSRHVRSQSHSSGPTDVGNAALLCGRHHTIVHRDRLAGTVTDHGVVWDLRPGSYRPPDPPPTWLRGKAPGPDRPSPLRPSGRGDLGRPQTPGPAPRSMSTDRGTNPNRRT
jgi:hypothetical protein